MELLLLLRQGVAIWNLWRKKNPTVKADLSSSDLRGANLQDIIGLTNVQIYGAATDQKTLLPDHLKTRK